MSFSFFYLTFERIEKFMYRNQIRDNLGCSLLLICFCFLSFFPALSFAQQQTTATETGRKDYKGWSLPELEQLFGPADRSSNSKSSEERVVFFGDSMFVLKQGEVSSWSNAGDLDARRKIGEIRIKSFRKPGDVVWLHPWEASSPLSSKEVFESLLEGKSSK